MAAPAIAESPARARILETAAELFYRHGVRAVGVDTIVEKSGVAKMTLYKHFASKDALVCAVLDHRASDWLAQLRQRIEVLSPAPAGRLLAVFDVLEEMFRAPEFRGCACMNFALETAQRDHPISRACLEHKRRFREVLVEMSVQAKARDSQALTDHVLLLIEGSIVSATMWGLAEPARRAKQAAQVLIDHHRVP